MRITPISPKGNLSGLDSKEPRRQGGALKPKFLKPRTEIPKQVRDDKKESQPGCHAEPWTDEDQARFSIWLDFLLPLADAPFIPVHRTGFSGAILIKNENHLKFFSPALISISSVFSLGGRTQMNFSL